MWAVVEEGSFFSFLFFYIYQYLEFKFYVPMDYYSDMNLVLFGFNVVMLNSSLLFSPVLNLLYRYAFICQMNLNVLKAPKCLLLFFYY